MPHDHERLELVVPARATALRHVRLLAAAVASDLGMDVEELDDLRVAVNELLGPLVDGAPDGSRMQVTCVPADDSLTVEASLPVTGEVAGPDRLATEILSVVVDEHAVEVDDGTATARLLKSITVRV